MPIGSSKPSRSDKDAATSCGLRKTRMTARSSSPRTARQNGIVRQNLGSFRTACRPVSLRRSTIRRASSPRGPSAKLSSSDRSRCGASQWACTARSRRSLRSATSSRSKKPLSFAAEAGINASASPPWNPPLIKNSAIAEVPLRCIPVTSTTNAALSLSTLPSRGSAQSNWWCCQSCGTPPLLNASASRSLLRFVPESCSSTRRCLSATISSNRNAWRG